VTEKERAREGDRETETYDYKDEKPCARKRALENGCQGNMEKKEEHKYTKKKMPYTEIGKKQKVSIHRTERKSLKMPA
jgi:hypothetical protein